MYEGDIFFVEKKTPLIDFLSSLFLKFFNYVKLTVSVNKTFTVKEKNITFVANFTHMKSVVDNRPLPVVSTTLKYQKQKNQLSLRSTCPYIVMNIEIFEHGLSINCACSI